MNLVKHILLC